MFVQQYNGYYYLTYNRCGEKYKIYLGKEPDITDKAISELQDKMYQHLQNQESLHIFLNTLPKYTQTKVYEILWAIIIQPQKIQDESHKKFLYDFIYHSNKSEGSQIAYDDFMYLIHNKIPSTFNYNEGQEVKNSFLARDFLMDGFVRNESSIKKLHSILTTGLVGHNGNPYQTGYKKQNNIVGNTETTDYKNVPHHMQILLAWYRENKNILFPMHLAFEFHYRFERIHPFADGNGRIGRLLMNKILYHYDFIPLTIFSQNRLAYFHAFEKSIERGSQILYIFLIEQYKKTLSSDS